MPKEEAEKIFNGEIEGGDMTDVIIIAKAEEESEITARRQAFIITITSISTTTNEVSTETNEGSGSTERDTETGGSTSNEGTTSEENTTSDDEEDKEIPWWEDKWDELTNVMGHLQNLILDIILIPFDALQSAIDSIQTSTYSVEDRVTSWDIVMEPEEITANPYKNQFVGYTTGADNLGEAGQKVQLINANKDGLEGLSLVTKIPVIPVEFYTMAKGQIEIFDVNFLTGNNSSLHPSNSKWLIFRNFVTTVMHVIIYIGASLLIITLILHGISIVRGTLTPTERANHIGGMHQFFKSVLLLVGSVVIMGMSIFLIDTLSQSVNIAGSDELPIRVNVGKGNEDGTDNKYSFSTNVLGYFRYMSQINQPRKSDDKSFYVVAYIILVLVNAIAAMVMFGRMLILAWLSIAGPIIAIVYAFNKKSIFGMTYQKWVFNYLLASSIQLMMAIIYRIILEIGF